VIAGLNRDQTTPHSAVSAAALHRDGRDASKYLLVNLIGIGSAFRSTSLSPCDTTGVTSSTTWIRNSVLGSDREGAFALAPAFPRAKGLIRRVSVLPPHTYPGSS
jgi:hypothetical protein